MGSWGREHMARQQLADGAVPHSCADKPGGTTPTGCTTQGSSMGK